MSEEGKLNPNVWMLTFADLAMLLLTFFVILLAMSSMDTKKLKNIMMHFKAAAGVLEFSGPGEVFSLENFIHQYNGSDSLLVFDRKHFLAKIESLSNIKMKFSDINDQLTLSENRRGVALDFHGNVLFNPGETTLRKEAYPILDFIAEAIETCPNNILIMGHTDDTPVRSKIYHSNWELSAYRGLSVLDYFLNKKGLSPSRFSVGGSGSSRPLYPNTTPNNRTLNRRVEIIFKHLQEL